MENRKSNRLQNYNYSQNGMYFITICTKDREEFFGRIEDGRMILNDLGKIVYQQLDWLKKQYDYMNLDYQVVMPNHLHFIIEINADNVGTGRDPSLPIKIKSLSELIGALKTTSSKLIHNNGFLNFQWQRSFYDHIIRNEISLNKIREYITKNPAMWEKDKNNIKNSKIGN